MFLLESQVNWASFDLMNTCEYQKRDSDYGIFLERVLTVVVYFRGNHLEFIVLLRGEVKISGPFSKSALCTHVLAVGKDVDKV